jgi:hypothetical protein
MKLDTALSLLRSQPLSFLRNNLVTIAGSSVSGVVPYYFGYNANCIGANEAFKFCPNGITLDRSKTGIDGKSSTALSVHNLRMNPSAEDLDISDIDPYVLNGAGPDIMITGQLSACILIVERKPAGQLVVAHIQPGQGRQSGAMLRQTLKMMGRFHGYGRVTHVFGLGDYQPRAHVIGIRKGGIWNLYAQVVGSGMGPVTNSVQIV